MMPLGQQQRGGSPVQTSYLLPQRWPHPPQLFRSVFVSVQAPPGLAPQQAELGNVQAAPVPQRQVLAAQVFVFPVQLAFAQQFPSTQFPEQQMPAASSSASHAVRSCTGR